MMATASDEAEKFRLETFRRLREHRFKAIKRGETGSEGVTLRYQQEGFEPFNRSDPVPEAWRRIPPWEEIPWAETRPRQTSPPEATGKLLATCVRGHKKNEELRISLDEYRGHAYVSLRVWERGGKGPFWPSKKGVTIRLSEIETVLAALAGIAKGEP